MNAIYKLIKDKTDKNNNLNSLDNAKAIDLLCHAAYQLENVEATDRSTHVLMDLYKNLDFYKNNDFNSTDIYCLNKEN